MYKCIPVTINKLIEDDCLFFNENNENKEIKFIDISDFQNLNKTIKENSELNQDVKDEIDEYFQKNIFPKYEQVDSNRLIRICLNSLNSEMISTSLFILLYLSYNEFSQSSLFLTKDFIKSLLEIEDDRKKHILYNIVSDQLFSKDLLLSVLENDKFMNLLNDIKLISLMVPLVFINYPDKIFIFSEKIHFVFECLKSFDQEIHLLSIKTLFYFLKSDLFKYLNHDENVFKDIYSSLSFTNSKTFCTTFLLINTILNNNINVPNLFLLEHIYPFFSHFYNIMSSNELQKILDYFIKIIKKDPRKFYNKYPIFRELIELYNNASFQSRLKIGFFFTQTLISFLKNEKIETINLLIEEIMKIIITMCPYFEESKILFCLNIIDIFFQNFPTISNEIKSKIDLDDLVYEFTQNHSDDVMLFSNYILNKHFLHDDRM